MKTVLLLSLLVLYFGNVQNAAADVPPSHEKELVLQACSMSQFADAVRTHPEGVRSWRLGVVKSTRIGVETLNNGQPVIQPVTKVEFKGRNLKNANEKIGTHFIWEVKHRPYVLGSLGGEQQPRGYFMDSWLWYEQDGEVIIAKGPPEQPRVGVEIFKLPSKWGDQVMAVLKKRKEKDEWFQGVLDRSQRLEIDENIESGFSLWALILARQVVAQDPFAWNNVLQRLQSHQDPVLLAAFIFPQVGIPIEQDRPWKALWDGANNTLLLDASAIACAAAASGKNALSCMVTSHFFRLGNRRPTRDELMKEPFKNCPSYQWAQELVFEIALLTPKRREDLIRSGICISLLDKMKVF